jgi:hypothetical protein
MLDAGAEWPRLCQCSDLRREALHEIAAQHGALGRAVVGDKVAQCAEHRNGARIGTDDAEVREVLCQRED